MWNNWIIMLSYLATCDSFNKLSDNPSLFMFRNNGTYWIVVKVLVTEKKWLQWNEWLKTSIFVLVKRVFHRLLARALRLGYSRTRSFLWRIFHTNNIHEKISPFWLVKSSAVFFLNSAKRGNKPSIVIGQWSKKLTDGQSNFLFSNQWRNWRRNFSLIAWCTCVSS